MIDRHIFTLPGVRAVLSALIVLDVVQAFVIVGQAWAISSAIVDLWGGASVVDQSGWIALFLCCFVGYQALVYVREVLLERFADKRTDELRRSLLAKVFSCGADTVQRYGTGNVSTMVLEGVDQVESYLRLILPKTVGVVVIPSVLLLWIVPLDWVSGVIALVAFPFIILYMVILGHTARDEAARQHETFQIMSNHFIDSLRGIDTLKLFGRGKVHGESIFAVSERFREATMKTLRVATLSGAVLDLFATCSLAAVAIMLGFRLVDGAIAFFPALFVLVLIPEYFKPVRAFATDYHASLDGQNALVSIRKLIDEPEVPHAIERMLPTWDDESSFEMHGVGFSYSDHRALTELSFEVRGFRNVGIVGTSGAGKSTLVNLLGGFAIPSDGTVTVAGVTLPDLGQPDWQRQLVYIPQNPYVFHATLRDNIAFYRPETEQDRIIEAVRIVGLDGMVDELPRGLDTVIGEGARALSGGQAQRIALARALLDDSRRILLFDEPTAHLDIETELELKERMLPLMEDRLVFFATHRLHWMNEMDVILVMEDGRIVETGTLDELRAHDGTFCRLTSRLAGEER